MRTTLIATGGTIAWHSQQGRMLSANELLAAAGGRVDEVVDLVATPSWDLSIDEMTDIAARVRLAVTAGSTGVVVTHGTDTMEETTWLTELMLGAGLRAQAAVLFTGAMRFADHPASDGAGNLGFALNVAREGLAIGTGVRVAWQGKLHPVRSLRKVDAAAAEPFISRSQGGSPDSLPEPGPNVGPNVELLKVGPLSRPRVPDNVAGLVLEGTGAAHVPTSYNSIIDRLVSGGVPVVLGSRCRDIERDPDGGKVLYAGDLTAEKAAIALMVGLGRCYNLAQLRDWWARLLTSGRPADRDGRWNYHA
jgi:L-asparaginase